MATIGEGLAAFGKNFASGQAAQATMRQNRLLQEQNLNFQKEQLKLSKDRIAVQREQLEQARELEDNRILADAQNRGDFADKIGQLFGKKGGKERSFGPSIAADPESFTTPLPLARLQDGVAPEQPEPVAGEEGQPFMESPEFLGVPGKTDVVLDQGALKKSRVFKIGEGLLHGQDPSVPKVRKELLTSPELARDLEFGDYASPEDPFSNLIEGSIEDTDAQRLLEAQNAPAQGPTGEAEKPAELAEREVIPEVEAKSLVDEYGLDALSMVEGLDKLKPEQVLKLQEEVGKRVLSNSNAARTKVLKENALTESAINNAVLSRIKVAEAQGNFGKLTTEERNRMSPIFNNQLAANKRLGDELNSGAESVLKAVPKIDELLDIANNFTPATYATFKKKSELEGQIGVLKAFLVGDLRLPLVGPGALSEAELTILNNVVRDPIKFLSLREGNIASLTSLKAKIAQGLRTKAKLAGIERPEDMDPTLKALMASAEGTVMDFDSIEQAESIGLSKGQIVTIGGQKFIWEE